MIMLFLGLDLGTQGIRGIIASEMGGIIAQVHELFTPEALCAGCTIDQTDIHEQNPQVWHDVLFHVLRQLMHILNNKHLEHAEWGGICSCSTSGTFLPIDSLGRPLGPAIMYDDSRALEETSLVQQNAVEFCKKVGFQFNPSFALPKLLWYKHHLPQIYQSTYRFLHANDYLVGLLTDNFTHSDTSNCLKMGYDFTSCEWPTFIESDLKLAIDKLPQVVVPGELIGKTSANISQQTGIPANIPVYAGATDSIMALVASGAKKVGDIFSTLGTTLVTRIISDHLICDPKSRVYCHMLPGVDRLYLPGGASSVGAGALPYFFPNIDYEQYDQEALRRFPTDFIIYPLIRKGERFPFVSAQANYYFEGNKNDQFTRYAATLEAIAFVERWSIELIEKLGATSGDKLYTIGGGSKSDPWLQIRADVTQKTIFRPSINEAAYGAAIVAVAAELHHNHLIDASNRMIRQERVVFPRRENMEKIDHRYATFRTKISQVFGINDF